jgi:hypothetical protein
LGQIAERATDAPVGQTRRESSLLGRRVTDRRQKALDFGAGQNRDVQG